MNTLALGFKLFFVDLIGGVVVWPFWWFTKGAVIVARSLFGFFQDYARTIGVGVWVKNLFVPMYGVRDWQSRIISVFMRAVQIVFRSLFLCALAVLTCVLFLVYLALPVVTAVFFFLHISAVFSL